MIFQTLRNGLLRFAHNDEPQRFLHRTLRVLLAMTIILTPCQAAIEFDGVDDYIAIPISAALTGQNALTISAWVKPKSIGPNKQRIIDTGTNAIKGTFALKFGTTNPYTDISGFITLDTDALPFTNTSQSVSGVISLNTWTHVVMTWSSGNQIRLYTNGNEVSYSATSSPTGILSTITTNPIQMGKLTYSPSSFYGDQELEDLRIYNRSLSTSEIEALYRSRSKRPSGSLANGLVTHYEMDDDSIGEITAQAKDSSGNLNHGQFIGFDNLVSNGFSTDVPAQIGTGTSIGFDGINDYLSTSTNIDDSLSSGFTISTWINANTVNDDEGIVSNYNGDAAVMTDRDGISIRKLNGNIRVLISDSGGGNYIGRDTSGNEINTATWHHIIASWNGSLNSSAIKIFVDNIRTDAVDVSSGIVNSFDQSGQAFFIGANQFAGSKIYFDGLIDDTKIYNKVLNNPEITFLYNGSGLDPGTSNLQALWTFDDDSALKDSSGNNNHGVGIGGDSLKYTEGVLRR